MKLRYQSLNIYEEFNKLNEYAIQLKGNELGANSEGASAKVWTDSKVI